MEFCNHELWQINSGGFVFRWWKLNKWHKQAGKRWLPRRIHIHSAPTSYYSIKGISTHFSIAALISEFSVLCIKRQPCSLPTRASSSSRQMWNATGASRPRVEQCITRNRRHTSEERNLSKREWVLSWMNNYCKCSGNEESFTLLSLFIFSDPGFGPYRK